MLRSITIHSVSIAVSALASAQQCLVHFDGSMPDNNWTSDLVVSRPAHSASAGQSASNGNPGPFRQTQFDWNGQSGNIYLATVTSAFTYDPATSGPVTSLSLQFDASTLGGSGSCGTPQDPQICFGGLIRQSGQYYISSAFACPFVSDGWVRATWQIGDLVAFTPPTSTCGSPLMNGTPDWTASGGVIEFGYWTAVCTNFGSCQRIGGVDNFRVVVNGGAAASQSTRVGSPANPLVLDSVDGAVPAIGTVWAAIVDHTTFAPSASLDALVLSLSQTNAPSPFGTLLIDPGVSLTTFTVPAAQSMSFSIPFDCGLLGLQVSGQAVTVDGGGQLRLTNALDLTFGT